MKGSGEAGKFLFQSSRKQGERSPAKAQNSFLNEEINNSSPPHQISHFRHAMAIPALSSRGVRFAGFGAKQHRRAIAGPPVRELIRELYYGLASPGPVGLKGSQFLMAG